MINRSPNIYEVLSAKENGFATRFYTNMIGEISVTVSVKEKVASEVMRILAGVDEALRYVTYLYMVHVY